MTRTLSTLLLLFGCLQLPAQTQVVFFTADTTATTLRLHRTYPFLSLNDSLVLKTSVPGQFTHYFPDTVPSRWNYQFAERQTDAGVAFDFGWREILIVPHRDFTLRDIGRGSQITHRFSGTGAPAQVEHLHLEKEWMRQLGEYGHDFPSDNKHLLRLQKGLDSLESAYITYLNERNLLEPAEKQMLISRLHARVLFLKDPLFFLFYRYQAGFFTPPSNQQVKKYLKHISRDTLAWKEADFYMAAGNSLGYLVSRKKEEKQDSLALAMADDYFTGDVNSRMKLFLLSQMISDYYRNGVPYSRLMRHILRFKADPANAAYVPRLEAYLQRHTLIPLDK